MFTSSKFFVSGITFKSLIHFEFIFVHGVREQSSLILFFKLFIYLFIWLHLEGSFLSCSTWAPQSWHMNSQLQYACGIQFPDQGLNLVPLHWERGVLTLNTEPPGKSPSLILLHVAVQFSQHHLLKKMSFPHCIFLPRFFFFFCPTAWLAGFQFPYQGLNLGPLQ